MTERRVSRLDAEQWQRIARRLSGSRFRSCFALGERELRYAEQRGTATLRQHAEDFVRGRLAPAQPHNDGRQTPWKGHPVFIAQHATGTCCRRCLARWHGIPPGRALSEAEVAWIVDLLAAWLGDPPAAT